VTPSLHGWTCSICNRAPLVCIETECPACKTEVTETLNLDFMPTGSADADHDSHIAVEHRFIRNQQQYVERGSGRFTKDIPPFFKEHIKLHEDWAFKRGASSRDAEIRKRIDELNKHAASIVAELTTEI
jgi:hypothetical protein